MKDLLPGAILVTLDISALYTNIFQEDGEGPGREAMYTRDNPKVPTEFLIRLLDLKL